MNDPLDLLGERIKQSLNVLGQKISVLEDKKSEFVRLKRAAASNDCKLLNTIGRITVYLGDGYFVEKTPTEVIEYADRRIQNINDMEMSMTENVKSAEKALSDLTKIGQFSTDITSSPLQQQDLEQQLPIFDIQEELDEEGNIISSSVQPRTGSEALERIHSRAFSSILNAMESRSGSNNSARFRQIEDVAENHKLMNENSQFDSSDLIEEKNETYVNEIDEIERPRTRGSLSSDSERPKSILKSPRISEYSSDPEDSNSKSSRRKSVTFSEKLDIVESDGSAQIPLVDEKQSSLETGYSISPEEMITFEMMAKEMEEDENDDYDEEDDEEEEYEEDEDEHGRTSGSFFPGISEDTLKRIPFGKADSTNGSNAGPPAAKVSRFKAARMVRGNASNSSTNDSSRAAATGPIRDIIERTGNISLGDKAIGDQPSDVKRGKNPVPINIGKSNALSEQEKQAIADVSTYDDMIPEGFDPEVFKKAMDYFLNSSMTEDEFVEAFGDEDEESHESQETSAQEFQPVIGDIREHEIKESAIDQSLDDENNVNMNEIAHEYQQMRQKFINRTGGFKPTEKEKELEPIESDKKVSRFKAARLHRRD